jgi:insulysin
MAAHDWQRVENHANVPAYTLFTKPIEKSQLDEREYRLIKLENGLSAMLIQDSKADIAAASLDVAVGHLSDPDDIPGLAHFCEHLLFMKTSTPSIFQRTTAIPMLIQHRPTPTTFFVSLPQRSPGR